MGQVLRTGSLAEMPKPWPPSGERCGVRGGDVESWQASKKSDGVSDGDDAVGGGVEEEDGQRVFGRRVFQRRVRWRSLSLVADKGDTGAFAGATVGSSKVDDGVEEDGEVRTGGTAESMASEVRVGVLVFRWRRGAREAADLRRNP